MKTKRPDSDWELMATDSDIVEPKRKPKQERKEQNECERPKKQ